MAITLNRQKFRHVDNIMFENRDIADRFLDYWRKSGNQRMGYLYGRYVPHKVSHDSNQYQQYMNNIDYTIIDNCFFLQEVPLGIRAEVCAIYEPPQESSTNSLRLLNDPYQEVTDKIADALGLQKVGWIITDLVAEDRSKGKVETCIGLPQTKPQIYGILVDRQDSVVVE